MKRKTTKEIITKTILYFFIPILLFFMGFILTILFNSYGSLSVITYRSNLPTDSIAPLEKDILKGKKVIGTFTARNNNLGIVSVRFDTHNNINDDQLLFRIREKGQKSWYYQGTYKVDQFQPNELFSFGFPTIQQSKGKTYEFELESIKGRNHNAVAVSNTAPIFVSKYQFSKSELLSDKKLLLSHIRTKFLNTLDSADYTVSSLIYFLPFLWYLAFIVYFITMKPKNLFVITPFFYFSLLLILGTTLLCILEVKELSSPLATIILITLWLLLTIIYKLDGSITFGVACLWLLCIPFFSLFGNLQAAHYAAIWTYYFLIVGVCITLIEGRLTLHNRRGYQYFLKQLPYS